MPPQGVGRGWDALRGRPFWGCGVRSCALLWALGRGWLGGWVVGWLGASGWVVGWLDGWVVGPGGLGPVVGWLGGWVGAGAVVTWASCLQVLGRGGHTTWAQWYLLVPGTLDV